MARLSQEMHPILNDAVLHSLNQNRIHTLADFMREDENRLIKIMNINDLRDFSEVKKSLARSYGILPIDGLTYYRKLTANRPTHLPSHIMPLDELLEGGLLMSNLIDICGPSIAGKTQLCTTIAINLATLNEETLWIDTKADFSARRIYKILKKRKCSDSEIRAIMQRIRIDTCNEPNKLIQMIEQLVIGFDAYKKAKLLVIDSLPALWFLFHGEHRISGCVAMTRLTNHLRKLAIECGMIILIVNLATQYFPGESGSRLDDSNLDDTMMANAASSPRISQNTFVPCLGKFWQSICSTRLLMTRPDRGDGTTATSLRTIRIIKSNQLGTGNQCTVNITDAGVR